ncbi:MAG: hypothetical protein WDN24_14255 [Sphingomonas sp.]
MAKSDDRHDENMQLYEREGKVLLVVIDDTYGTEEENWEAEREKYRLGLEAEFGLPFEDADIGPGASLPAFATLFQIQVPAWTLLFGLFFMGKKIKENGEAWRDLFGMLKRFLNRPVYVNRQGAAVLAMEAVLEDMGGLPKAVQLLGYGTSHITEPDEFNPEDAAGISDAPPTLYLGFVRHVFNVEADGTKYRASVHGRTVTLTKLEGLTSAARIGRCQTMHDPALHCRRSVARSVFPEAAVADRSGAVVGGGIGDDRDGVPGAYPGISPVAR